MYLVWNRRRIWTILNKKIKNLYRFSYQKNQIRIRNNYTVSGSETIIPDPDPKQLYRIRIRNNYTGSKSSGSKSTTLQKSTRKITVSELQFFLKNDLIKNYTWWPGRGSRMSCTVKSSGFSTFFTSPVSERTRSPTAENVPFNTFISILQFYKFLRYKIASSWHE